MAQTPEGALKIAAKKAGITVDEYITLRAAGLKRCTKCKEWRNQSLFNRDKSRSDGLTAICNICRHSPAPYAALRGRVSTFKGKRHTESALAKMSNAAKARPSNRLGKVHTIDTRAKISRIVRERAPKGSDCHSYRDGKVAERRGERVADAYKRWRYDVYLRDKFTCQHCGDSKGGNLHAHHIKPFATHPELRLDISNGITLCEECHKAVHAAS